MQFSLELSNLIQMIILSKKIYEYDTNDSTNFGWKNNEMTLMRCDYSYLSCHFKSIYWHWFYSALCYIHIE